jgi:hypothetical protein
LAEREWSVNAIGEAKQEEAVEQQKKAGFG